jgi:hypothetical protein
VGAGLVVDNRVQCTAAKDGGSCLSALIDTSGGSDDGFVQSNVNAVVQAWAYYGMKQMSRLASWLGGSNAADVKMLDAKAAALKAGFNRMFVDGARSGASAGAVCDGMCTEIKHKSVHSSFHALAFGLVEDDKIPGVWGLREAADR